MFSPSAPPLFLPICLSARLPHARLPHHRLTHRYFTDHYYVTSTYVGPTPYIDRRDAVLV